MKYRKKPVVIEAIRLTTDNFDVVCDFMGGTPVPKHNPDFGIDENGNTNEPYLGVYIETLEGKMLANYGDYIIKGVNGDFLTPRQAEAVDVQKIRRLFSSPLGKTLLSAKTLRREFKFSILTDAEAYSPEAAGEQVMLQGVVDCFWQEPDGIVILDFKTDYIDGDLQQKAERYAPQLHAYAAALSRIFQTPVKKTILYFFSANQPIEI